MDWTEEHVRSYAAFVSRRVRQAGLKHFDRGAVARVVEHGATPARPSAQLSTRLLEIGDLVTEASFWAGKADKELVRADRGRGQGRRPVHRPLQPRGGASPGAGR